MIDPKEAADLIAQIKEIAVSRNLQDLMDYPAVIAEYMFRDESSEQISTIATVRYLLTLSNEQVAEFEREAVALQELYETDPEAARERHENTLHTVYTWYNVTLAERMDEEPLDKDSRAKRAVALILSQKRIDESIRSLDPDSDE